MGMEAAMTDRPWDFDHSSPRQDYIAGRAGRMLPPEVKLTDEDVQRIAVAKAMNDPVRSYCLGLLAGMRREK